MLRHLAVLAVLLFAPLASATVPDPLSSITYVGNGSTTAFPLKFQFFSNSELVVTLVETTTGISTPQTLGVHFSATGAGLSTGTVTFFTAPPIGKTVKIVRTLPLVQQVAFSAQGTFSPRLHEKAFDRVVMMAQQIDRRVGELADAGVTVSATLADVVALRFGDGSVQTTATAGVLKRVSSDVTVLGTTYASVSELSVPVAANAMLSFDCFIVHSGNTAGTGIYLSVNGPASPTRLVYGLTYYTGAADSSTPGGGFYHFTTYDQTAAFFDAYQNGAPGTSNPPAHLQGTLVNGPTAGTFAIRAREEASAVNLIRAGSYCVFY